MLTFKQIIYKLSRLLQIETYRNHLEDSYRMLIEKSNAYKYIDETESDSAAFKAMRIRTKIDQILYLERENLYSFS